MGYDQPTLRRTNHQVRSDQALGTGATSPVDPGIPEGLGRQHGRPGQGRTWQLPQCPLSAGWNAAHDGNPDPGICRHAGHHVYSPEQRGFSANFHRRTRLAGPEPTYEGYSIGRWIDEFGHGRYNLLEVETRGPFEGPRSYDASGCHSTSTINQSLESGFILTRTIKIFCMMKSL